MNRSTSHNVFLVVVMILLMVWIYCVYMAGGLYGVKYAEGLQAGAKIGIALDSPDGYRADEVRGSCADLFDPDTCIECHDLGWSR